MSLTLQRFFTSISLIYHLLTHITVLVTWLRKCVPCYRQEGYNLSKLEGLLKGSPSQNHTILGAFNAHIRTFQALVISRVRNR